MRPIAFGAHRSPKDKRDHRDRKLSQAFPYPQKHEVDMGPIRSFYQGEIGICTGAALVVAIMEYLHYKRSGKYVQLSVAFLYIVTKVYVDKNLNEGSALRSALKAAYKYGVCTEATFPTDIDMSHEQFVTQVIPKTAWNEALNYTIGGYISIPIDESLIAAAMWKYGPLYARMEVGNTWFTPSWLEKDISPLTRSKKIISGHAVALTAYDLSNDNKQMWLKNSWGPEWFRKGNGLFNYRDYKPTEVWAVTLDSTMHMPDPNISFLDSASQKILDILRKIGEIF